MALASLTVFTPGECHILVHMYSWGQGRECLGRVHWYGGSCWRIGLVHGLALVLVGKGAGTKRWQCHIIPVLPFQTSST